MHYAKQLLQLCEDKKFNMALAQELISNVDVNSLIDGTTYLYKAVQHANTSMVQLLLEHGADANFYHENDGPALWDLQYPDFFETSETELLHITKLLLDKGADPNIIWEDESLFDYIAYEVFNEVGSDDRNYVLKFFLHLVAYGGNTSYCSPKIYAEIDKNKLSEYELIIVETEDGKYRYGKILKAGKLVAEI